MKKLLLLLALLSITKLSFGQTWTGTTNTDWDTPTNWNGNVVPTSIANVTIPAALTNYPVLASDVSINTINMVAGSAIDFNGKKLTINSVNAFTSFTGATLNNTLAATDIVIDLNLGGGGYYTVFRNNTVNDNITFNLTGSNTFFEADQANTQNTFSGNVSYLANGSSILNIGNGAKSTYGGKVSIVRTVAGASSIFAKGATIVGDFLFTNTTSGSTSLGDQSNRTAIGGKVDITVTNTATSSFILNRFVNQTSGGVIAVQNSLGFDVRNDTIVVNSLSITGYTGNSYGTFQSNKISGNVTLVDDASYGGGYYTTIYKNEIGGTSTFTNNGTNTFYDANAANTQNTFVGNVSYTANGSGALDIGNGAKSTYGGNVGITRTVAGSTTAFSAGASIAGNFLFSNPTSGSTTLGNSSNKTAIVGMVNITQNNATTTSSFNLYRFVNQAVGGVIAIQNSLGFNVQNDTLVVNSLSITDYTGNGYGSFQNNKISGNVTIADHPSYGGGYYTSIYKNEIGGTSTFTNNGTNTFYDANTANTQNTFVGNVSYTANGSGALDIGNGAKSTYGGNVGITRTVAGSTTAFSAGASIAGNFLFSNPTSGSTTLGNSSNKTAIVGTVDITQNNATTTSSFNLYRFVNQAVGGVITIQNSLGFNVQNDTLVVNSLSITDYTGNGYGSFQNNKISGNVTIADHPSYGGGYYTSIYKNEIGGTASFTNKGTNTFYDADAANTANKYLGNVTYNKIGGNITIATNSENEYGKGITFNSASGITINNVKFNGGSDGVIEQMDTQPIIIPNIKLEKTGMGKVTLNDPLTISNSIAFTSGRIATTIGSELIFPDNIGYTGYSNASFVEGPVKKVGNDAFIFPVGGAGKQAPVSISAPASTTDEFRAQYVRAAPANPTLKEASIDHLSQSEYWLLDRPVGASDVFVTLSWDGPRSGLVTSMTDLRIAHFTGGQWKNEGNGSTSGTNVAGTIMSQLAVGSFSPFTLASVSANSNPLPLNLLSFAGKQENNLNILNWRTANEVALSHFEIERSETTNNFERIGEVKANGGPSEKVEYEYVDHKPQTINNQLYYRLRIVDLDGKFSYSKIIKIENNQEAELKVYPNPATEYFSMSGNVSFEKLQILDASGRLVKEFLPQSDNKYSLSGLSAGIYLVKDNGFNNLINSKLVVK